MGTASTQRLRSQVLVHGDTLIQKGVLRKVTILSLILCAWDLSGHFVHARLHPTAATITVCMA